MKLFKRLTFKKVDNELTITDSTFNSYQNTNKFDAGRRANGDESNSESVNLH